ncbi:ABC transporter permease [Acidobacteria bacterium AH-259-D05]|nr:ABC transporter permease [Acidobacteria bacterium AH-259-D05]
MWQLVLSNIRKRPTRTLVSIVAVALGVVLLLVSVGLSYGQLSDHAERARRIGGDLMLQPSSSSIFLAVSGGTMPVEVQQIADAVEGVEASTPIFVKFVSEGFFSLFGVDRVSFQRVNRSLVFPKGRMFEGPSEAIIDTIYASVNQLDVGDPIQLLGHQFTVVGIYQEGTASRVMVPLGTLQALNGTPDKATVFFIRVGEGESIEAVEGRLAERFTDYKISKTAELQNLLSESAPGFKEFLTTMSLISIGLSFAITLLAMYSNIMERTREIGILKSLGASKRYIVQLILQESLLVCLLGVGMGFIMTTVVMKLILMTFPTLPVDIQPVWRLVAVFMPLGGGCLGALYPAIKAARLDPVKALGYQ